MHPIYGSSDLNAIGPHDKYGKGLASDYPDDFLPMHNAGHGHAAHPVPWCGVRTPRVSVATYDTRTPVCGGGQHSEVTALLGCRTSSRLAHHSRRAGYTKAHEQGRGLRQAATTSCALNTSILFRGERAWERSGMCIVPMKVSASSSGMKSTPFPPFSPITESCFLLSSGPHEISVPISS